MATKLEIFPDEVLQDYYENISNAIRQANSIKELYGIKFNKEIRNAIREHARNYAQKEVTEQAHWHTKSVCIYNTLKAMFEFKKKELLKASYEAQKL